MLGKFGVGCCCDPLCLWRNPTPWSDNTFIDWYHAHAGYKRYKLGPDDRYTVIDTPYTDGVGSEAYHFDSWMDLIEYDSAIESSESDYFAVTREQIETDLSTLRETFAASQYDEVPLYFIYLFVIDHSAFTRTPRQYLIPVHADMQLGTDFATLYGQAIKDCKMSGLGTVTRPDYYDFFGMILAVTTANDSTTLMLTWDDRCIAELCSRIVSTKQAIFADGYGNVHVGTCSYNRVGDDTQTWNPLYGRPPLYNGWPDGRIKGVECTFSKGVHFDALYTGICFTPYVQPDGSILYDGPRIPEDKLYLFNDWCKPTDSNIIEIYEYKATRVFIDYNGLTFAPGTYGTEVITGTIPASGNCGEAHYELLIERHNERYDGCTAWCKSIISVVDNDAKTLSYEEAEARAEEIFTDLERIANPIVAAYPTPEDLDYYVTKVNCEGSFCKKHTLYDCNTDYLPATGPSAGNECGALKIASNNLTASSQQCRYATVTKRQWLKCTSCRVVECRSPVLPSIDDAVAVHTRIPTDSNGKAIDGYIEVRSAFCNAHSCSAYKM